jgi:hypothetical protein
MSLAPKLPPVRARSLENEVRDVRTGQVLGWINGDRALRQALTRRGFRLVAGTQRGTRRSSGVLLAG